MTIPMLLTLSLTLASLCGSIYALFAARRSLVLSLSRQPSELLRRLEQAEMTIETLTVQLRNIRSRLNMAAYRDRRAAAAAEPEPSDVDSGAEWRRRMNAELASGRISAIPNIRK